eukprot:comp21690_c0_seq1/m.30571 comp21690_c0_seq1/g.30571  ORF comp21690_c0_seq1/g.30571 comp21690_c0_seq1/m.30571 type:complete len:381 (-) comp21690_c0_seq1:143-1285(-)
MDTYPWRFWGCVASAAQPYLFAPDETSVLLDVSQATLIADDTTTARHHLFCEIEGNKYHLCSFVPGKIEHHMLSGSFHNDVKFYVTGGKCEVSILGRVKIIPDVYREPPDTMMYDPDEEEEDDMDDETAHNTLLNAMNNAPITQQRLDILMGMPSKKMEVPDDVQPLNLASIMQAAISQAGGDDEDDDEDDEDFEPGSEDDDEDTTMNYDSDEDDDDSNEDEDEDNEDEDVDEEEEEEGAHDNDEVETNEGAAKTEGKAKEPDSDSSADYGPPVPKELQQKNLAPSPAATPTPTATNQTPKATTPALAANGKKLSAKQVAQQLHSQPASAPCPTAPPTEPQRQAPATAPKPPTQPQKQKEGKNVSAASTPQQKGKGSKKK